MNHHDTMPTAPKALQSLIERLRLMGCVLCGSGPPCVCGAWVPDRKAFPHLPRVNLWCACEACSARPRLEHLVEEHFIRAAAFQTN